MTQKIKKFCLKKITVPSDCWKNLDFFRVNFSLQKDYSSKWVGEIFPSFFEKKSKIRSHVVKKSNVFVSQNMNFMKISKFFSDSKNGFGTFLVKNVFHQWSDFHSKKILPFQVGGGTLLYNTEKSMAPTLNPILLFLKIHFFRLQLRICYEKWIFKIPHTTHFRFFKSLGP